MSTHVKWRSPNIDQYKRSFVAQTICELKFPTLLELGGSHPPTKFANALRRTYPTLDAGREIQINLGQGTTESMQAHIFRSAKAGWVATLKHSSVSIEGSRYDGFADLKKRVKQLTDAALPVIDSDVWTRVGLRFVNVVGNGEDDPANGWINPSLVAPLESDQFEEIAAFGGAMQLGTEDAGVLLRHQLQINTGAQANDGSVYYVVDIDCFQTSVPVRETLDVLEELHLKSFNAFDWTLDEKARDYLRQTP